jgi:hypothetical protein
VQRRPRVIVPSMDLTDGFQIEEPEAFVPWGISEAELLAILPIAPHHVTAGYYVIDCMSLNGLQHAPVSTFVPMKAGCFVSWKSSAALTSTWMSRTQSFSGTLKLHSEPLPPRNRVTRACRTAPGIPVAQPSGTTFLIALGQKSTSG